MAVCPKCSTTFTVFAGQPAKCPKCGYTMPAPKKGTPPAPGAARASGGQAAPQQWQAQPGRPYQAAHPAAAQKTDGFAIAGFVLAFLFSLLGLIFSIMSLNRIKKNPALKGKGLAIAGIIISVISLVLGIFLVVNNLNQATRP